MPPALVTPPHAQPRIRLVPRTERCPADQAAAKAAPEVRLTADTFSARPSHQQGLDGSRGRETNSNGGRSTTPPPVGNLRETGPQRDLFVLSIMRRASRSVVVTAAEPKQSLAQKRCLVVAERQRSTNFTRPLDRSPASSYGLRKRVSGGKSAVRYGLGGGTVGSCLGSVS